MRMDGSKLVLIFLTLFILGSGVTSQDRLPATDKDDLGGMSEAHFLGKQILTQLLDLKSHVETLSGIISSLDTRTKNIENLMVETDVKISKDSKRMDGIEGMIQELSGKIKCVDGPKSEDHERVRSPKPESNRRVKINCKGNATKSIIPNLTEHMAVTQRHLLVLLNESREERRKRADDHQDLVSSTLVLLTESREERQQRAKDHRDLVSTLVLLTESREERRQRAHYHRDFVFTSESSEERRQRANYRRDRVSTSVLLTESREERRQRADDHREILSILAEIHPYRVVTGAERTAKIETMLQDATATFFKGEYMTGAAVYYQANGATTYQGGCQNLKDIKSMRMSNSCVRVFKDVRCEGKSRALYPQPNSGLFVNFLTSELPSVESVGPCVQNEFQFSIVSANGNKIVVTKDELNVRQVPDFVDFSSHNTYRGISSSTGTTPVQQYYMDRTRLTFVYGDIYQRHLDEDVDSSSGRNLAIPPGLGGPVNQAYNRFSQTETNFGEWRGIMDRYKSSLRANALVYVHMTFLYENASVDKPYGFYYQISESNTLNNSLVYGFIPN